MSATSCVLCGSATVDDVRPNPFAARVKTTVRYADPMAWALVLAIAEATEPLGEPFRAATSRCSLIQVAPQGPPEAMAQVSTDALRGFASPMRFPSATPSAPTGLACIVHGLRGPTLSLTMPVPSGVEVALTLSAAWLARGVTDYALIGTASAVAGTPPRAACVVLSRGTGLVVDAERITRALLKGSSPS